jgi:hypothetical protein
MSNRTPVADFFGGLVVFIVIAALGFGFVMLLIGLNRDKVNDEKRDGVCSYLHGKMHDDVCIVNGKVVPTK